MTGVMPEELIEEIRNRVDLVGIISEYVRLNKSGENFKGLCPFHSEKTPSFTVSPKKNIFHCFGCGTGGNVYTFIMKTEGLSFVEAVKFLAQMEGISLPSLQSPKQIDAKETLYEINQIALDCYKGLLHLEEGSQGLDYFKKRGLNQEIIEQFKLGYAPAAWQRLKDYLSTKNYPLEKQLASGLIIQGKQAETVPEGGSPSGRDSTWERTSRSAGHYYDRFRNRIIFPIFDSQNRPVGFGARVLDDSVPKYINSPETLAYSKGKTLYGLNWTKDSIRKKAEAILVEGYLDAIITYQSGFDNVVASLGTAFTPEQAKLLKRYAQRVIVVFDPDTAGVAATLRGLDVLMEQGLEIKIVSLPQGFDPAEFLIKKGSLQFSKLVETAMGWLDYRFTLATQQADSTTTSGRIKILNELIPTIGKITNSIERQAFIKRLAEFLSIEELIILEEIKKAQGKQAYFKANEHIARQEEKFVQAEKGIVGFLLEDSKLAKEIISQLSPDDFSNPQCQEIFRVVIEHLSKEESLDAQKIVDKVSSQAGQLVSQLAVQKIETQAEVSSLISDYVKCLKIKRLNQRKLQIEKMLSSSPSPELLKEYQELILQVKGRGSKF